MLHGQPIEWCHVHLLALPHAELQLLQQGGQEKEDLPPSNGLPSAIPLPQAESQHLHPFHLIHFGAISTEETLWVEGLWILPKLPGREYIRW